MSRRNRQAKERRDGSSFVAFPHDVLRSPQFANLSPHAVKLLVDFLSQYRGNNNGDLCAAWTLMRARGWRSRDTLEKAKVELIERGFISLTRQGGRHVPNLYGVTFYALDDQAKLDVREREFPRGAWLRGEPGEGRRRSYRSPVRRVNSSLISTIPVLQVGAASVN